MRRIRCAPACPTSQPGLMTSVGESQHLQQGMGIFGGPTFKFLHLKPHFCSHKSFHQGSMQRLLAPPPHHGRVSPAQPRFCVTTPEPMAWQRLAWPFPLCGCCSLLGQGATEQERVAVCSRMGPGTGPSLPCASTSLCSHSSLGLCPERHKGTAAARRRGGRRASLCQDVCPTRGPHCHKKLCQTFPLALSQRWLHQLSPPPRPRRAWNQRAV